MASRRASASSSGTSTETGFSAALAWNLLPGAVILGALHVWLGIHGGRMKAPTSREAVAA